MKIYDLKTFLIASTFYHSSEASTEWPNSDQSFTLIDGSVLTKLKEGYISLDGKKATFAKDNVVKYENQRLISVSESILLSVPSMNGYKMKAPLELERIWNQDRFVAALIDTGLYCPTADEHTRYIERTKWTATFNLGALTLTHRPHEVEFTYKGESFSQKIFYALNDVIFRVHSTKIEFVEKILQLINILKSK